jgi:hypothetical protein
MSQRCLYGPHQPEIIYRYAGKSERDIYWLYTLLSVYSRCWLQEDRLVVSLFSSLLDQGLISVSLQMFESKSMSSSFLLYLTPANDYDL